MDDNATRILNAAVAGQEVMNENSAVWAAKAAIANKKDALDDKITEIEQLDDGLTDGSGESTAKRTAREHAAKTALKITKPMTVYARDMNDPVLEAEIDMPWSALRYGKDQDVIDRWQLVHDRSATHEAALTAGGYIEAPWILQLQAEIDAFKAQRGKPKAKRSDTKALNQQIAVKIKELQTIKTSLLDLLVQYKESNALFYTAVKAAFEKDMTGKRHLSLRVYYTDEATGVRLAGVAAEIVELGLRKISSKNGRIDFSLQELPQGNYVLNSALKNYKDSTLEDIGVEEGRLNTLEITLQKGQGGGTTTGTISGHVQQMGMPTEKAMVTVEGSTLSTTTDKNGNYTLENVGAGPQNVTASLPAAMGVPPQTKQVTVEEGKTATLNFDF